MDGRALCHQCFPQWGQAAFAWLARSAVGLEKMLVSPWCTGAIPIVPQGASPGIKRLVQDEADSLCQAGNVRGGDPVGELARMQPGTKECLVSVDISDAREDGLVE